MAANPTLDEEQVAFLLEHHELLDALFDLAETDDFRVRFGELPVSEVLKRFENTLEPDYEGDEVLRQRYQRLKAELETGAHKKLLQRLRGASLFDDLTGEDER
jgi:hypothetical protein